MTTANLMEYLRIILDMEKSVHTIETTISNITNQMQYLGIPETYAPPPKPNAPTAPSTRSPFLYLIATAYLIICFAFPDQIFESLGVVGLVASLPCFIAPFMLLGYYSKQSIYEEQNQKYQAELKQYWKEYTIYDDKVSANKRKMAQDKITKVVFEAELKRLHELLIQRKGALNRMYEQNILFPKYRGLVMIASIYEYFQSGRCSTLEGHEGAYNILENEIRLDRITLQIDQVISKLNEIRDSQYMVFTAIQDSQRQAYRILESTRDMASHLSRLGSQAVDINSNLAKLQKTSELTAYSAERAEKELNYMNRMNYLTGRYNDVGIFQEAPPN